ncbi:hypothetical protein BDP27DRAFT_1426604 [Rhodocollybia butyracea]|uniref:Uncharacterized protein n=1 Tax=Rhodocollybia butyracea TaxID=206335 RepID=A0A9P5U295_9AGAR|nr:hypothetical protein BDP27DRAFT_1426604 [Rhodocollybia butyracea]
MSNSQNYSEKAPYEEPAASQQAVHISGAFFAGAHSFDISGAEFVTVAGDMHQTIRNDHSVRSGFNNRYTRDTRGSEYRTNNYNGAYNDNRRFQSTQFDARYEASSTHIGSGRGGGNYGFGSTPQSQHTAPDAGSRPGRWSQHSPPMLEPRQSTYGDQRFFEQSYSINNGNMSADFAFAPDEREPLYAEPDSYYERPGVKYNPHNPFNQYSRTTSVPIPHGPPTPARKSTRNSMQRHPHSSATTPEGDPRVRTRGMEQMEHYDEECVEMESEMSNLDLGEHRARTVPTPYN